MTQSEIIKPLKEFKEKYAQKYGMLTLGIFGFVAHDNTKKESDVDVVVKMEKQDLFNMIGIKSKV